MTITRREFLNDLLAAGALFVSSCGPLEAQTPGSINERMTGDLVPTHDPCIIKSGDTYYVYATATSGLTGHVSLRTSKDLLHWTYRGTLFSSLPDWALAAVPGTKEIWAPDISYFNGEFHLYYAVSSFGTNRSAVGLATTPTLDPDSPAYRWSDRGLVLMSTTADDFNAIDPNHVIDRDGRHWLVFGSFWGGIKMRALDPVTGKPGVHDTQLYTLARRPEPEGGPDPIEAPFLIERGGYYYLFASYDYCCKGVQSTYYTAVGRSRAITGPYLGRDGRSMGEGGGLVVLKADLQERGRWRGPGHCAILRDPGQDYIVYHAYDAQNHGAPALRISPITWTADGWPAAEV